ncbi:MAG: aldo/keto reductase [Acidobacteriales bacterium]|nr:aldo/keto reductase [Terriglobales bacterium]
MNQESERSFEHGTLGRTGRAVLRLGLAASYGVPTAAVEKAIDAGVNYLYWGSRRTDAFAQALRNQRGRREEFVLVLQSYSRMASLIPWSVESALRKLDYDHAEVLLLGMWNKMPPPRIVDACRKLKERGLVRHLAFSTHNRPLIPRAAAGSDFDVFHVRYNATHTGAERDVFPHLAAERRPGLVSYTATDWKRLLGHRRIPKSERVPTAGDCYRFVLSNPAVDVVMCGASTAAHMDHALEAFRKGPLDEEEMAWMRRVGKAIYRK